MIEQDVEGASKMNEEKGRKRKQRGEDQQQQQQQTPMRHRQTTKIPKQKKAKQFLVSTTSQRSIMDSLEGESGSGDGEEENPFGEDYREIMKTKFYNLCTQQEDGSSSPPSSSSTAQRRVKPPGKALWRSELGQFELIHNSKNTSNCGHTINGKVFLHIEEALCLFDTNSLELYIDEDKVQDHLPPPPSSSSSPSSVSSSTPSARRRLTLPEAFGLLGSQVSGCSLSSYLVYSHLKRIGFILFRTGVHHPHPSPPSSSSTSRFELSFDLYKPKKSFSKRQAGLPNYRLSVCNHLQSPPSLEEVLRLKQASSPSPCEVVPVIFALENYGSVTFTTF
jgi:hypothetical protein